MKKSSLMKKIVGFTIAKFSALAAAVVFMAVTTFGLILLVLEHDVRTIVFTTLEATVVAWECAVFKVADKETKRLISLLKHNNYIH